MRKRAHSPSNTEPGGLKLCNCSVGKKRYTAWLVEVVSKHRATWQAANLRAEIERQLRGHVTGKDWERVAAEADSVLEIATHVAEKKYDRSRSVRVVIEG